MMDWVLDWKLEDIKSSDSLTPYEVANLLIKLPTRKKIFYLNTLMLFFCLFVFKEVFLAFLLLNFLGCATWSVEI